MAEPVVTAAEAVVARKELIYWCYLALCAGLFIGMWVANARRKEDRAEIMKVIERYL